MRITSFKYQIHSAVVGLAMAFLSAHAGATTIAQRLMEE